MNAEFRSSITCLKINDNVSTLVYLNEVITFPYYAEKCSKMLIMNVQFCPINASIIEKTLIITCC